MVREALITILQRVEKQNPGYEYCKSSLLNSQKNDSYSQILVADHPIDAHVADALGRDRMHLEHLGEKAHDDALLGGCGAAPHARRAGRLSCGDPVRS